MASDQHFREDVLQRLTRIETNLEAMCRPMEDLPQRVRKLENWRWYIAGGLAIVAFAAPLAVKLLA